MKPSLWILTFIVCMTILQLAACSGQEPAAKSQAVQRLAEQAPAAPEPATAAPATPPGARVVTGELRSVDPLAKTLTIKNTEGNEQTFSYTDSTEIAGASGSQGLSAQQGNQVIVRYLEQDDHTAVRVEIVPR